MNLKGKRALVTGGIRGIGKAILLDLVKNGCDVVFTYIITPYSDENTARELENEIMQQGVKAFSILADATSLADAEKTAAFTLEKLGGIDILVNNAGITKDNLLLRMTEEDFD